MSCAVGGPRSLRRDVAEERSRTSSEDLLRLHRSKITTTPLLVLLVGTSFLMPVENRYFRLLDAEQSLVVETISDKPWTTLSGG